MWTSARVVFVFAVTLFGGCGSDTRPTGDGGLGADGGASRVEREAFLTEYCDTLLGCCAQAGAVRTQADCRSRLPIGAGSNLPPTVVADCRAALSAARAAPDFCDRGAYHYLAGSGCSYALLPPQSGAPFGASCESSQDCASTPTSEVSCHPTNSGDTPMSRCIALRRGALGDGPCVRTGLGFIDDVNPIDVGTAAGVVCSARDGLRCDPVTDTCVALGGAGATCGRDQDCLDQHVCRALVCVRRASAGESCAEAECTLDSFCDEATQRCRAKGVANVPCATDGECHSGICREGQCLAQPQTIEFGVFCAARR